MKKAIVFYRLPNTNEIVKKSGLIDTELSTINFNETANNNTLFYIAPFNNGNKAFKCVLKNDISKFELISYHANTINIYDSKEDYTHKVKLAINNMKQSQQMSKVVLARCKKFTIETELEINSYFLNLCLTYPNAFVYAISSAVTGTWVAATPELLLKVDNNIIETTAIAGTMLKNTGELWGNKEIDEHHQVELFIEHLIHKYEYNTLTKTGPNTINSGHIKHLYSHYKINANNKKITTFLNDLNPTPAVGGLPSKEAIEFINKQENLNRNFYTGMVGVKSNNCTQLFVNLRCMEVFKTHVNAYAGCGITAHSNEEDEWLETENKLQTLTQFL